MEEKILAVSCFIVCFLAPYAGVHAMWAGMDLSANIYFAEGLLAGLVLTVLMVRGFVRAIK